MRAKSEHPMTPANASQQVLPAILNLARDHRHPLTPAEAKLRTRIRSRGLGYKIRRQHPIWRFIADFYCAEAKLIIEIDGDSHTDPDQAEYDAARTEWLEERGYKVTRFSNEDVHRHLAEVLNNLSIECQERVSQLASSTDV